MRYKLLLTVDSILGTLRIDDTEGMNKIFHHLSSKSDGHQRAEGGTTNTKDQILSSAEKRSKLLKVLREYVEEPEKEERSFQKQQAMFGTFNILQSVTSTIQPDREGHLWDELRESIEVFKSPDRVQLKKLLTQYKDILVARSDLMKRNNALRKQNSDLRMMLKDYMEDMNE